MKPILKPKCCSRRERGPEMGRPRNPAFKTTQERVSEGSPHSTLQSSAVRGVAAKLYERYQEGSPTRSLPSGEAIRRVPPKSGRLAIHPSSTTPA